MNQTENAFLRQLEMRGKEQAKIAASSPMPESLRPLAALVGEHSWKILLGTSFVASLLISVRFYSLVYVLFSKGVLSWLLH